MASHRCVYTHTHIHIQIYIYWYTHTQHSLLKDVIDARIKQLKAKGEWEKRLQQPEE